MAAEHVAEGQGPTASYLTPLLSTALLVLVTGRALTPSIALSAVLIIGAAVLGTRAR